MRQRCESYEGCRGTGEVNDLTDDGSGRTCYCDCPAGRALMAADRAADAASWPSEGGR